MSELRYTKDHEWVSVDGDVGTIGISDFAQNALGDVVYIEVPQAGAQFKQGAEAGVIESVKAASELYSPVSGEVVEGNAALEGDPGLVNNAPLIDGWIFKIRLSNTRELDALMNEGEYATFVEGQD